MRTPLTPMHAQNPPTNYKMYQEKPPSFSYRELSTVSLGNLFQCLITLTLNMFSLCPVGTFFVSTQDHIFTTILTEMSLPVLLICTPRPIFFRSLWSVWFSSLNVLQVWQTCQQNLTILCISYLVQLARTTSVCL